MMIRFFLPVFFMVFVLQTIGQENNNLHSHEHEHHHEHEVGISVGPAWFFNANEAGFATHLHYVYNFPHTKFGLGIGYERIFDEHQHNFFGIELNYRPVHQLTFNLSPGIAYENTHKEEKEFALHFETVYEFEFGSFHIGPMSEIAWHPEDFHVSLGIHIGFGF